MQAAVRPNAKDAEGLFKEISVSRLMFMVEQ